MFAQYVPDSLRSSPAVEASSTHASPVRLCIDTSEAASTPEASSASCNGSDSTGDEYDTEEATDVDEDVGTAGLDAYGTDSSCSTQRGTCMVNESATKGTTGVQIEECDYVEADGGYHGDCSRSCSEDIDSDCTGEFSMFQNTDQCKADDKG